VAEEAYAIYLKEGRPQEHAEQNWFEAEAEMQLAGTDHTDHPERHAHLAADFRNRFWITLALTLVAVAITTAYLYSSAVVFGLTGKMFFWGLATLVAVVLLGRWIEMLTIEVNGTGKDSSSCCG